jgi:hypothetical protein
MYSRETICSLYVIPVCLWKLCCSVHQYICKLKFKAYTVSVYHILLISSI